MGRGNRILHVMAMNDLWNGRWSERVDSLKHWKCALVSIGYNGHTSFFYTYKVTFLRCTSKMQNTSYRIKCFIIIVDEKKSKNNYIFVTSKSMVCMSTATTMCMCVYAHAHMWDNTTTPLDISYNQIVTCFFLLLFHSKLMRVYFIIIILEKRQLI